MSTYFRYDGTILNSYPTQAIAGAFIAVLTQPANITTQPGSPLAQIFAAPNTNSASISSASWIGGQLTFGFTATPPSDVVPGSYIAVVGVSPSTFNNIWKVLSVSGNNVVVAAASNPGTYISGGAVTTSVLPNPFQSDGYGHYFFYAATGFYTIQEYSTSGGIQFPTVIYLDQVVLAPGGGSVTSVAIAVPTDVFTVTGPITSNGTITIGKQNNIPANFVAAGPISGSPGTWTFRALTANDIATLGAGSVSSVALTVTPGTLFTSGVTGSPITTSGTIAVTFDFQNQNANLVLASPTTGGAGPITARSLIGADLPFPGASSIGGVQAYTAVSHQFLTSLDTSGVLHSAQPAASDLTNGTTGTGEVVLQTAPTLILPILQKYTVALLPAGVEGQLAYATNGRKVGEASGFGSGVPVYWSADAGGSPPSSAGWHVYSTDALVQA
jgi:hypothetical protein